MKEESRNFRYGLNSNLAKLNTYLHSWENCGYDPDILRGNSWRGRFQMSLTEERQVTGGKGRRVIRWESVDKLWICEVYASAISVGS